MAVVRRFAFTLTLSRVRTVHLDISKGVSPDDVEVEVGRALGTMVGRKRW